MRVEATIVLAYDILDDPRTLEAYQVSEMSQVLDAERILLSEEDYMLTTLVDTDTEVTVVQVWQVAS